MKFRLATILWIFALFASAMATFPFYGIVYAIMVLWFWMFVFKDSPTTLGEILILLAVIAWLYALSFPAVSASREGARVAHCRKNLVQVSLALMEYKQRNGVLPAIKTLDAAGRDLHSWRLQILPFLGQEYASIDPDRQRPWDDPANSSVVKTSVTAYCCSSEVLSANKVGATTSYFAVTGPRSAWSLMESNNSMMTDDPSQSILLIEQLDRGIAWSEPRDLTIGETLALLTLPLPPTQLVHLSRGKYGPFHAQSPQNNASGFHVAFADGSVRFVSPPISRELATALLTANGGEEISEEEFQQLWKPELDYSRIYSFSMFVVISLMPLFRLRTRFMSNNGERVSIEQ